MDICDFEFDLLLKHKSVPSSTRDFNYILDLIKLYNTFEPNDKINIIERTPKHIFGEIEGRLAELKLSLNKFENYKKYEITINNFLNEIITYSAKN